MVLRKFVKTINATTLMLLIMNSGEKNDKFRYIRIVNKM